MGEAYIPNPVLTTAATAAPPKRPFEFGLEGLRGFAALVVVWCHAIGIRLHLDPGFMPSGPLAYGPPAGFSVLLFFVLSGYVIGIRNEEPLRRGTLVAYCRKRLVRLYPLYALSLGVALLVATGSYPLRTILGNLAFVQVAAVPVIWENSPIWSLNSEVLFYALFIPLSAFRLNVFLVAAGTLVVGGLNFWLSPRQPLLSTYALGFTFWLCGLLLARHRARLPTQPTPYRLLLSALLLFASLGKFNYLGELLHRAAAVLGFSLYYPGRVDVFEGIIAPADLAYLPYAVLGVLLFTGKRFAGSRVVLPVLWLLPCLALLAIGRHWQELPKDGRYVLPTVFYLAALLVYFVPAAAFERAGAYVLGKLIWLGSISYGLYIIHFPLLCLFRRVPVFAGSAGTFAVRFGVYMAVSVAAAWVLEKRVQPLARRWLVG